MTQDQVIILLLKITLISGVISIAAFVAVYWRLAPWWRNQIGRTLVVKDVLLILIMIPTILSLFFQFNRLTSHIAAWLDVVLFGLITPVMIWRAVVWVRIHRGKAGAGTGEPDGR